MEKLMSRISVEAKPLLPALLSVHPGLTTEHQIQYTKVRIIDRDRNGQEVMLAKVPLVWNH